MKNKRIFLNYLSLVMSLVILGLSSCSSPSEDMEGNANAESEYVLSVSQFESSKMELGSLEKKDFHEIVKANGMFDVPPQNQADVSVFFGGYVKDIPLYPGEKVNKGQVLFTLESPEFIQMQQSFLSEKGKLTYLETDYERQKTLAKDNITSQKNFLKAEADYTVCKVMVESLKKKLALMNIDVNSLTVGNLQSTANVISPISGYVTKINMNKGSFLNPADVAMSIVDTDHLHLELNIFEQDLLKVKIDQPIRFKLQNGEAKFYDAKVHLVNKTVDPESRMIGIHGHLSDEENHAFNPGMYVEAEIYTSSVEKLALADDAIVDIDNRFYVLVKKSSTDETIEFEKREVLVGIKNSGYWEIKNAKDFNAEDKFLTVGAFNLIHE